MRCEVIDKAGHWPPDILTFAVAAARLGTSVASNETPTYMTFRWYANGKGDGTWGINIGAMIRNRDLFRLLEAGMG